MKKILLLSLSVSFVVIAGLLVTLQSMQVPSLTYQDLSEYAFKTTTLKNGMSVNYKESGDVGSPTLLMVHGGSDSLTGWGEWLDGFPEYRVIAVDLPGHGLTDPMPDRNYSRSKMSEFLEMFIEALELRNITLVGHSMGGEYSLQYTIDNQENVRAIIVLAPGVYRDDIPDTDSESFVLILAKTPLASLLYEVDLLGGEEGYKAFYREYVGADPDLYPEDFNRGRRISLYEKNRDTLFKLVLGMYDDPYIRGLNTIKVPMLILWGDQDPVSVPKYAGMLHDDVESSTLIMYEGVGHGIQIMAGKKSVKDARSFMSKILE